METIFYVLACVFKALPFVILIIFPFKNHLRLTHKLAALGFFLFFVLFFGVVLIHVGIPRVFSSLIVLLSTILFFCMILDMDFFIITFWVCLCKNFVDMVVLLGNALLLSPTGSRLFIRPFFLFLLIMAVCLPLVYLLYQRFLVPISAQTEHFGFWKYLWIMPLFYYILFRIMFLPDYLTISFPNPDYISPTAAAWIIGIMLSYIFLFHVITETLTNSRLKEELRSAELLTQMQKEQYLMLQNNIEETRRIRHDIKQQLIVIQDYIKKGFSGQALDYIASCLDQFPGSAEVFCTDYALNSIIRYYVDMARMNQVSVSTDIRIDECAVIPEVDFCTLLGNLMLNAVESCIRQTKEEKFIRMAIASVSPYLVTIDISNSYDGDIQVRDGVFFSSKRDSEGLGTISIRQVVIKYDGTVRYQYENGVFRTSILLNLPMTS